MNTQQTIDLCNRYILNTYTRVPVVFVKGKGSHIWDSEGKEYLDFFPGWAVSGIGHCHKRVVNAIKEQAEKILHVSNNYYSEEQVKLAQIISETSFGGKVFFSNSGAEANEGAIKLARAYGAASGRYKIITMEKSFHGRTLATLTATGQDKVKKGFAPLPEGFSHIKFNNINAVKEEVDDETIAIMLELIQGEGGINIADDAYVRALRKFCDEKDILLIADEVQTGMGRTGRLFAYQHYGVEPDIMTLAKSLGGGLPIGAMVAKDGVADFLKPGMHASTFGGSPVVCAASLAVFEAIEKDDLISNANNMGEYLLEGLENLAEKYPGIISKIKQKALMVGVELSKEARDIVDFCFNKGLLINCTQNTILRIMPPITVDKKEIDKALAVLDEALAYTS
ncbi:MAG: aspartate aminotransferase family protein [Candidatus Omnitrophota bacterium]